MNEIAVDHSDPLHNHSNIGAMGIYKRDGRPATSSDQVEVQRQQALRNQGWGRETPPSVRSNATSSVRSLFDEFDEDHDGKLDHDEVIHLVEAHPQLRGHEKDLEGETFEEFKHESERLFLQLRLQANEWNVKRTAESLGMQRSNLYKKIERYNLK